jgi:hypothetical protein
MAWSCSNPCHGDGAKSNALTCSTASPVLGWSWPRSRTHTSLERLRVLSETLAWLHASFTNLDPQGDRVKRVLMGLLARKTASRIDVDKFLSHQLDLKIDLAPNARRSLDV